VARNLTADHRAVDGPVVGGQAERDGRAPRDAGGRRITGAPGASWSVTRPIPRISTSAGLDLLAPASALAQRFIRDRDEALRRAFRL